LLHHSCLYVCARRCIVLATGSIVHQARCGSGKARMHRRVDRARPLWLSRLRLLAHAQITHERRQILGTSKRSEMYQIDQVAELAGPTSTPVSCSRPGLPLQSGLCQVLMAQRQCVTQLRLCPRKTVRRAGPDGALVLTRRDWQARWQLVPHIILRAGQGV
jgi:hypothetical protein